MNKTEDIFRLIKTMSKSEKGYFKKFVQGFSAEKDNNYLILFDLLDKTEQPEEGALKKHFATKKKKVNLRALRPYLYQLIIKSLRLYHEKNNPRFEAANRLNEIEILMDKGFEVYAYNLARESVEHCHQHELHELKLIFLGYEHLTFGEMQWDQVPAIREKALGDILHTTRQLEYTANIRHLEMTIVHLANSYFPTADADKWRELEALMQNECLQDDSRLTVLEALLGFHNVWRAYYGLKGERDKSLQHTQQIISIIESRNAINKSFIGRYMRAMLTEAKLLCDLRLPHQAWALLEKMKAVKMESVSDEYWKEMTYVVALIYFLKNFHEYRANAKALAQYAEEKMQQSKIFYEGFKLLCIFDLAVYYFLAGNAGHSLDLLATILNRKPVGSRIMFVHARLLQIVIHYDLGNKLLLPSLIKSTFRYMAKADVEYEFERIVLKFFTRVLRPSNHVILSEELEWMKNEIEKSSVNEFEKSPLRVFNYITWLTARAKAPKA